MFDKLLDGLKKLNGSQIAIPIQTDEDGYFDKECPNEDCHFRFKVLAEDWKNIFKDEAVFCPMCGTKAPSDDFISSEFREMARAQAVAHVRGTIHNLLKDDADDFNRKQPKGGFVRLSISVPGNRYQEVILPIQAKEALQRKLQCVTCQANYSILGSAFFCPNCGNTAVDQTLDAALRTIEDSIKNLSVIKEALQKISRDEAETTCRSLIEKGLLDCVVTFQHFCSQIYKQHPNSKEKIPFNAFQKLDVGGDLWMELLGETYSIWLGKKEMDRLNLLFQRRHLLQHTQGLVDLQYIEKTRDQKYGLGNRIIVNEDDVLELTNYIRLITRKIKEMTGTHR